MGYLIGCISPSYLIGRKKGYDVRTSGSCNAGASNTVIMAGKAAGIFVALFDILKARPHASSARCSCRSWNTRGR